MKSEEVYSYSRLMEQQYFITAGYFIADTIQVYHLYNILKFLVLQGTKALIELAKNVFLKYPIKSFCVIPSTIGLGPGACTSRYFEGRRTRS